MIRRRLAGGGCLLALLVSTLVVSAQPRATEPPATASRAPGLDPAARAEAERNALEGQRAFEAGDYATAVERLGAAHEVLEVPTVGLRYARALEKVKRLVEAEAVYAEVVAYDASWMPDAYRSGQEQAQGEARTERAALRARIPALTVDLEGTMSSEDEAAITITVDGETVAHEKWSAIPVNPGVHRVRATRGEETLADAEITAVEGEKTTVPLSLAATPPPASGEAPRPGASEPPVLDAKRRSSPLRKGLIYGSLGVGAVGVAAGAITGILLLTKKRQLDDGGCHESDGRNVCPRDQDDERDAYNALRPVSTVGFVVGAVGLGVGTTLLVTQRRADEPGVQARVGLGSVTIEGRF